MDTAAVSRDEVVTRIDEMPSFPRIVTDILATLDDPEANLNVLVNFIEHDPVITARVLSLANVTSSHTRRMSAIRDIFTATSLIGMGCVRQMAVIGSLGDFFNGDARSRMPASYWQHSVAVGVCCEELALHVKVPVSVEISLVAGLLHDVGQLWLYRFRPEAFREIWSEALDHKHGIELVERARFGVDHATIGTWLVEHWGLQPAIAAAISHHHAPEGALEEPLVCLVHVAEVLANALDLAGRTENRVTSISAAACRKLGLVWNDAVRPLFGRMEARSRHANTIFQT